jgi:hypothetical protein
MRGQLAWEAFCHFLVGLFVSFIIWAGLNEIAHDMFGASGFPASAIVVWAVLWTIYNTDWGEPAKRRAQEADDLRRRKSIGKRLDMPPEVRSRFIFKADADLLNIVDHSLGAPTQMECNRCFARCQTSLSIIDYRKGRPIKALPEAPAVLLIYDGSGVYLVSNGDPHYMPANLGTAAFAEGCNPHRDSRYDETIRALVVTDFFTECLPWAAKIKQQIDAGAQEIIIEISRTSLELMPSCASAERISHAH